MLNEQRARNNTHNQDNSDESSTMRDIHALTPPPSSSLSMASSASGENFTSISREFNALVLAGSRFRADQNQTGLDPAGLGRIGEDRHSAEPLETNPLAIVLDPNPLQSPPREVVTVQRVKKEEAETKINAWQNAKIAKINNRFKREETVINGWEDKQEHKSSSWMKHVERNIEEKRAKALEKMRNDIAKAHRKAEEKRASAEGKRGTKIARVLEIATFMRAMGRAPSKRSFF
ncbi:remorin 4.1-like [Salvia hispanica]|uniref:remorin 4.1-like n=1 Tax=Salvia hispanica TaxID=49212 RepID=UPI002009CA0C|nr:remorin 4.1-like [Salvia hispanica]